MRTSTVQSQEILVTGVGQVARLPEWVKGYGAKAEPQSAIVELQHLPPLTVVQAGMPATFLAHRDFIRLLVSKQRATRTHNILLLVFHKSRGTTFQEYAQVLEAFPIRERANIELAFGSEHARGALREALAKLLAGAQSAVPERGDPLGQTQRVIDATADLRGLSGKLSAERIAEIFGLSVAEVAGILGRKRQTVSKTPEAESLQPGLLQFERIARLRAVLSPVDFPKWLRMPNDQIGGEAPLDWVRQGRTAAVADFVDDMLSGNPT